MKTLEKKLLEYETQYKNILKECLNSQIIRQDRTGVGCRSVFNASIKIDISENFPILTGRKIFQKTFDTEFLWFINGETNIERFKNAGVKIWDAWADDKGELGPVYGYQMRNFNGQGIDQFKEVIESLTKDKDSRRHIICLWNPIQTKEMKLPPCYLYFQFFVDNNKLNMFVLQRSGDVFLGVPYDIAFFSKILLFVSEKTKYKANLLDVQIIDAHIYTNQIDYIYKYLEQAEHKLPSYNYKEGNLVLNNYICGPIITCKVAI